MRKVVVTALLLLTGGCMYAQDELKTLSTTIVENADKYKVETNRFWSNSFITVGGGTQMYFGDHNKQQSFGERLSPALDIAVGKWFTPAIGVRLMYSGLSIKGATQNGAHAVGGIYDTTNKLYKQKFDFMNLHGDVILNMSNLLFGYNEKRVWNVSPYVGIGWMVAWESPQAREFSGNLGLINSFRLCSALDLNLDARLTAVNDRFDGEVGGKKQEGLLAVSVGLTYKFPARGWKRGSTKTVRELVTNERELQEMRDRLATLGNDKERFQMELKEANEKLAQKPEVKAGPQIDKEGMIAAPTLVTFAIGKTKLTRKNRVNLGFLAKAMKTNPGVVYTVTGYTDKGTGTPAVNERIGKARTKSVFNCLVKEYGVDPSQLEVINGGSVDNMFYNDASLSRAVIIEVK